jgi:cytochrome c553
MRTLPHGSIPATGVSKTMMRSIVLVVTLLLLTFAHAVSAQLPRLDELMRQKLAHAQDLLEHVVLAEHVAIERYAYELILLSEASTWSPLQTPEYLNYAADFQEAATGLIEAAQNRNSGGVSSAYSELVATCIQCHKDVRGAQWANRVR